MRPADGIGVLIEPNREGKVADTGDRALESKYIEECIVRDPPSMPKPSSGSSGIGVGGVGVLGGRGIGRWPAILSIYNLCYGMREWTRKKEDPPGLCRQLHNASIQGDWRFG